MREEDEEVPKPDLVDKLTVLIKKRWPMLSLSLIILIVLIVLIILVVPKPQRDKLTNYSNNKVLCSSAHETYQSANSSLLGIYKQFAVAVDSPQCSTVGKEILQLNGSAVDAAISAALCNGIANAQSTGIGGGHFMLIYLKEKRKFYAIDARESAPMSTNKWTFLNRSSLYGGLSSAIPGEVYGFWRAHQLGGRLSWETLFQPAIRMCRYGFKISQVLAFSIKRAEANIRDSQEMSDIFINPLTNQTYKQNDYIKMLKLADTLELISRTNINEFYNGNLTKVIVDEINENGGMVTVEDFNNYKALIKPPLSVNIDAEHRLYTQPPPSSGILVPFILRIMRGFNIPNVFDSKQQESLFYHRLIEAFKHAFAIRSKLGDEAYEDIDNVLKQLKDENFLNKIRSKINDNRTYSFGYYESLHSSKEDHGTTHLSVLAQNGDAVSLSSTINIYFGAKYIGKHTGIIYNNQMDDFSTPNAVNYFGLKPSELNFIKGGKRPMSSMSPIIVLDNNDNVRLILGASGGSKIITSVAQVAIKNLWMNKNIKDAIDERRVHHQLYPTNEVEIEEGFSQFIQSILSDYGHEFKCFGFGGSVLQGITKKSLYGPIEANSDFRKGGLCDGL